jgi:hypothetical protein
MSTNGRETTLVDINHLIRNLDGYLIVERIKQAGYSSNIYPKTTNTIRILTMWDYETNRPFIAAAMHRFGTDRSFPVDNVQQGGLFAGINLDTGEMRSATSSPYTGEVVWHEKHPDSGEQIQGVCIPNWSMVKEVIIRMARVLPYIPYIGWDVVLQEKGFKIIEGNDHPGVDTLQAHCPFLKDPRIKRFYEAHGVI